MFTNEMRTDCIEGNGVADCYGECKAQSLLAAGM
jgi:hypothetical protein